MLFAARLAGSAAEIGSASGTGNGPYSERLLRGWEYYRGNLGGVWEAWRGKAAAANVTWDKVETMPHCFNAFDAVDPDHAYYQGPGWYRIHLQPKNPFPNGRTLLYFEGAGQKTQVFVHLQPVGDLHVGGYDEFAVDITEPAAQAVAHHEGSVPVAVFCDNSRDLELIPSSQSDFALYGGLYRYVNLVYVPAVSLEGVHIVCDVQSKGSAKASVRARLYNPTNDNNAVEISIRVTDPAGNVVHTSKRQLRPWIGEQEVASFTADDPKLWSPDSPSLYSCEVSLSGPAGAISTRQRFGFRHFEFVEHGPFKLNGERLLLRGTHRHQDHAGVAGAVPDDITRKEFLMMKEMGANFIRLAHYQQSQTVLDLCDELGILVWEEIPWCRGGLGGERYREQARRMLRNMMDQDRNHPSIILWGLGNENDWPGDFPIFNKQAIRDFMAELNGIAHEADPTRKTVIRRCDFAKDIPDVYSPSIWAGWYRGSYKEYKSSCEEQMKKVNHFFHAEWGADSHARRHVEDPETVLSQIATGQGTDERSGDFLLKGGKARVSSDGDWSETYACDLFDWTLKEQDTMNWLTGSAQWIFKDFCTPLRPENPVPRVNQKGVTERDLTPKESYYVFQSYWSLKPMVHIYGHTWPVRWGAPDQPKLVRVYSNCPEAELFLNDQSCGVKRRNSQDFPCAGLRWSVRFREGQNRIRVVAHKDAAQITDEIAFHYQTTKWGRPSRFELREIARQPGVVTVEATLFDDKNTLCLDANTPVRFTLAGAGSLIDNLGTSSASRALQLYNGRAMISLKTNNGQSWIGVTADGLPAAFLKVV